MIPSPRSPRPVAGAAAARPWLASLALHGGALAAMCVMHSSAGVDVGWQQEDHGTMVWLASPAVERIAVPDDPAPPAPPQFREPAAELVDEPAEALPDAPPAAAFARDLVQVLDASAPLAGEAPLPDEPRRLAAASLARAVAKRPLPAPPQPVADAAAAMVQPSPLAGQNAPPRYPFVPWRRGIEGTVVVELDIDAAGNVCDARVAVSSGNAALDESARSCLQTWHFTAARKAGRAIACTFRQSVVFRIAGQGDPRADVAVQ